VYAYALKVVFGAGGACPVLVVDPGADSVVVDVVGFAPPLVVLEHADADGERRQSWGRMAARQR
jgi:hypothetical protein